MSPQASSYLMWEPSWEAKPEFTREVVFSSSSRDERREVPDEDDAASNVAVANAASGGGRSPSGEPGLGVTEFDKSLGIIQSCRQKTQQNDSKKKKLNRSCVSLKKANPKATQAMQ